MSESSPLIFGLIKLATLTSLSWFVKLMLAFVGTYIYIYSKLSFVDKWVHPLHSKWWVFFTTNMQSHDMTRPFSHGLNLQDWYWLMTFHKPGVMIIEYIYLLNELPFIIHMLVCHYTDIYNPFLTIQSTFLFIVEMYLKIISIY